MRYSRQRELVMRQVQSRCDHPTADEIYTAVRDDCPGLSLGTVYRNLNGLVEAGRVRRVSVPGQATGLTAPWPITTICSAPGAAGWRTCSWTKRRWTR